MPAWRSRQGSILRDTGTGCPSTGTVTAAARVALACLAILLLAQPAAAAAAEDFVLDAAGRVCRGGVAAPPAEGAALESEDRFRLRDEMGWMRLWRFPGGSLKVTGIRRGPGAGAMFFVDYHEGAAGAERPLMRAVVDQSCRVLGGRKIVYADSDGAATAEAVQRLDAAMRPQGQPAPLNPPVPDGTGGRDCTRVALLDNGVNYLEPEIEARLARDPDGRLVGYDFWDDDDRPFDFGVPPGSKDPRVSAFSPRRHGSMVASVFIRDAPRQVCIVPYRYFPQDPERKIGAIVERAAADGVRVVSISSGRSRPWPDFEEAMRRHPDMLFVIAAGNEGADLRNTPNYPASYDVPNAVVVAAADETHGLWARSNHGAGVVHVAVRATDLPGRRFDGSPAELTGTSFASPRIAAVAGAIAARDSALSGAELRAEILALARGTGVVASEIPVLTDEAIAAAVR